MNDTESRLEYLREILAPYHVPIFVVRRIAQRYESELDEAHDAGATFIAEKIQSCIPAKVTTVPDARVQGAWTDAARIASNRIGKREP